MKKTLSLGAMLALALLVLSGCMKVDSSMTFEGNKVITSVDLHVEKSVLELDDTMAAITKNKALKELTPEERAKICKMFVEEDDGIAPGGLPKDDVKVVSKEKGVDDKGRLVCNATSDPIDLAKADLPYKATYDEKTKIYKVTGNSGDFLGKDDSMSQEQLKSMGAEISVSFRFPGKLTNHTFGGGGTDMLPAGVTLLEDNGVRFDLLEMKPTSFSITADGNKKVAASSTAANTSYTYSALGVSVLLLVAGAVLLTLRSSKRKAAAANASSSFEHAENNDAS